jgi:outer membrane protein assembly factor BamE (lipoprotein component of BamABCDE complex)
MRKRSRVLLWAVLLAALVGAGLLDIQVALAPRHRITFDNLKNVQFGMTEQDVETILGAPSGDYSNGKTQTSGSVSYSGGVNKKWIAADCAIELAFAPDGRVGAIAITDARESLIQKLRRILGL